MGAIFSDSKPDLCNSSYLERYLYISQSSQNDGVTFESLANAFCGSLDIIPSLAENMKLKDILKILNVLI